MVGIADDWYKFGRAPRALETFKLLDKVLGEEGQTLQPIKSGVLIPALDSGKSSDQDRYVKQLIEHIPRNAEYITALGTAVAGHFELNIGPRCGDKAYHEYANERTDKAEMLAGKAKAMLETTKMTH